MPPLPPINGACPQPAQRLDPASREPVWRMFTVRSLLRCPSVHS